MDKREMKRAYKARPPRVGVYQILNKANGKRLVGCSLNLYSIFNRERFTLEFGNHKNAALQNDWNEYGTDSFAFEVLEELKPDADPGHDYREEMRMLEEMWLEKLQPYGENGYNEKGR